MAEEIDPGQGALQGQDVATPDADQEQTSPWSGLPEDIGGYIEAKGFKDVAALASSYKNLEALRGVPEDRLLVWPDGEDADLSPIYDRLGRPESPDAYENALGDGFNDAVFKAAAEKAHELGLSQDQFKGLQEVMGAQAAELAKAQEEDAVEKFSAWKTENEAGFQNAARLMANIGIGEEQLADILSGDKAGVYDFLAKVADKVAEGKPVVPDQVGTPEYSMTPAAAKAKVAELLGNQDFLQGYLDNKHPGHAAAVKRITDLNRVAGGSRK